MSAPNTRRWSTKLAALDANLLVSLDALLQEANVTRAAGRLGVTQSAMSQTLARLRHQFDDAILVQVGRRMELTPFAQRVRARLRQAISELEAVVTDRPGFDPASASRRFVLAMVDYLSLLLLPPLHRRLAHEAPLADLAIHAPDAGTIAPRLEEGVVDLYVGVCGDAERGLRTRLLFRERLCVLARRDHPLIKRKATSAEYARWPHVLVSPRRAATSLVDRAFERTGLERRVAVEVPYFALVPGLLRGSELVATVPERVARLWAKEHDLAVSPAPLDLPGIDIHLAWHPRYEAEPGVAWLRQIVERVVEEERFGIRANRVRERDPER